jgi:hypothetical protein
MVMIEQVRSPNGAGIAQQANGIHTLDEIIPKWLLGLLVDAVPYYKELLTSIPGNSRPRH